ncbi:MAG: sigma-70 region 4 domain-containing protein [Cyclobacteriaceae bacterium]|nr:sigma-70 region 4 domain-containing protein [Cyclobacteriaceae bacterium]
MFSLHSKGLSNRKIADILGISRNTANQYISIGKKHLIVLQKTFQSWKIL